MSVVSSVLVLASVLVLVSGLVSWVLVSVSGPVS
jgi:hypothetical protein